MKLIPLLLSLALFETAKVDLIEGSYIRDVSINQEPICIGTKPIQQCEVNCVVTSTLLISTASINSFSLRENSPAKIPFSCNQTACENNLLLKLNYDTKLLKYTSSIEKSNSVSATDERSFIYFFHVGDSFCSQAFTSTAPKPPVSAPQPQPQPAIPQPPPPPPSTTSTTPTPTPTPTPTTEPSPQPQTQSIEATETTFLVPSETLPPTTAPPPSQQTFFFSIDPNGQTFFFSASAFESETSLVAIPEPTDVGVAVVPVGSLSKADDQTAGIVGVVVGGLLGLCLLVGGGFFAFIWWRRRKGGKDALFDDEDINEKRFVQ